MGFGNGKFEVRGQQLGRLVDEKNRAYGDSFNRAAEALEIFYPNGVNPEQYKDMLGVVRVLDKISRLATMKRAFGENPWADIAGYGLLGMDDEEDEEIS